MANTIDANGITIQSLPEIIDELTSQYQEIYGQDINVGASTPDGSMINIQAQAKADLLNYSVQLYNCFNVDTVTGVPQDILYKLNNIYRQSSNYSYVEVNVTVTKAINLQGLDGDYENPNGVGYTVADNNGNQYILLNSVNLTGAGTYGLEFRAQNLGAVEVIPNTITTMITVLAGISGVNNPASQYITGTNEETDAQFRIRRNKSTAISGKGFDEALEAQLSSVPDVKFAKVWDNRGNTTDGDGIPAHSIWAIVQGGLNDTIGKVIYSNIGYGVGMKGSQVVNVDRPAGNPIQIKFDRPVSQSLSIRMTVISKTGVPVDGDYIKQELANTLTYGIYESADSSSIISQVLTINPDVYVSVCELSLNGTTWSNYVIPSSKQNFFAVALNNISITTGA